MKASRLAMFLGLIAITFVVVPATAQPRPHGCVSATSSYWLSADLARRSAGVGIYTNQPCSFYFSPGDTFSGSGAFAIRCSTGGALNHADAGYEGGDLAVQEPIPQPCQPGAVVTIHANQPFQGGGVVAGNPAFVETVMPSPSLGEPGAWRYIIPPYQTPGYFETQAPLPNLAPFGMVEIIPDGTSVTVTIADDLNPNGSFLFKICQKNEPQVGDYYCGHGRDDVTTGDICYGGPTTLEGVVPGNAVQVTLWWATSPCPDAPTTGTLTVVGGDPVPPEITLPGPLR